MKTLLALLLTTNMAFAIEPSIYFARLIDDEVEVDLEQHGIDKQTIVDQVVEDWKIECEGILAGEEFLEDFMPDCPNVPYSCEKRAISGVIRNLLVGYGAGKAFDAIIEASKRDDIQGRLDRDFERMMREKREAARKKREEADRKRRERRSRSEGERREWGGHMDNRPNPNVARGGYGV